MNTRNIMLSAAAVLATGAFAGCGDDENNGGGGSADAGSTPAAVAPTTVEGTWAQKLCTQMAGKAETVTPPNVDASSPEKTKTALVGFFSDIGDQLKGQIDTIEQVGPPPGSDAEAAWEKAVDKMRGVNREVGKIRRELRGADASTESAINKIVANLGEQLAEFTEYQGPIAELREQKTLTTAITDEPACAQVS